MDVGDVFISKAFGHEATVTEVLKYPLVKVVFKSTGNEKVLRRCNLRNLEFRDVDQPTVHGIGIVGDIKVRAEGKLLGSYVAWTSLLDRCHKRGGILERVCTEWLSFENFKLWHDTNVPKGWVVDKDYKYLGNTFYSPTTCTPLPVEINSLLTKTIDAKGYTLTRNGRFDSRVRVEGGCVVRKTFDTKREAYKFFIDEKIKYIGRLSTKYENTVPSYVFDNATLKLQEILIGRNYNDQT